MKNDVTPRLLSPILSGLLSRLSSVRADRGRGRSRPFVTLAYAQSLDGSIAGDGNRPLTLSCESSLALTHELRAAHDAILVGIGTVIADNPRLNVRLAIGDDPRPIVVDSRLRIPHRANLLARNDGADALSDRGSRLSVWVAATHEAPRSSEAELLARGAEVLRMPALPNGWVDLGALLRKLDERGVGSVLVEGGARILTSFLEAGLVDYLVVTIAPRFVGGVPAVGSVELTTSPRLGEWRAERVGDDLVIAGDVIGGGLDSTDPDEALADE